MKKIHCKGSLLFLAASILLSGCGPADGPAESETTLPEQTVSETVAFPAENVRSFAHTGEFESTDGSILFSWDLEADLPEAPLAAADVIPHNLTQEDARRIGEVLFADTMFYVPEESFEEDYSKAELQTKLDIWKQYTDPEKMSWLYPYRNRPDDTYISHQVELVSKFLEEYTQKLESAPEEKQDAMYDWTFHLDGPSGKGYYADCVYQGIPYRIRSNGSYFSASLYTGAGPSRIEEDHYRAVLCRTEEPGETQVAAIREKAMTIAEKLELGDWWVETCKVAATDLGTEENPLWEYTVNVSLMPCFDTAGAISWGMHTGWTQEGMELIFAPGGELLSFSLERAYSFDSAEEMTVLTPEQLLPLAQEELAKQTSDAFGAPMDWLESLTQERQEVILCKVTVNTVKYGLAETAHPTHAGKLRFQPAMLLYGMAEYVGAESGTVYLSDREFYGPDAPARRLLAINAADGSVLEYPQ